jgi:peptidoglycan biosynthesis protein MviN/MurJ (putative lipid II flippase)
MTHSFVTHSWTLASFFASAVGLYLLYHHTAIRNEDLDESQWMLFAMSFAYWMMHCVAIAVQPWIPQEWVWALFGLKFCAVMSALLTFSCALSLPLNEISAANRVEEEEDYFY